MGVIVAGGLSSRMGGGDKCLLELAGKPLLAWVVGRIQSQIADVILNANGDANRFSAFGLPVVGDKFAKPVGPLGGVLAGMEYAVRHGFSHIVTVAADTPFFPLDMVDQFIARLTETKVPIVIAATKDAEGRVNRHPTFAIWPVNLREDLHQAIDAGTRKIVVWTDSIGSETVVFPSLTGDPFFNVNTPQDLLEAAKILPGSKK